jgi:hypothetical protein
MGENSIFDKWCQNYWISMCKRMTLNPSFTPYPKTNSKCIKDLSIRAETIKYEMNA